MSIIKTPPQDLIRQINAVEVVAFGSNPSRVNDILSSLPKDFIFGNYPVQNADKTIAQNLPAPPSEKNTTYKS
jgi:hypothetical protein